VKKRSFLVHAAGIILFALAFHAFYLKYVPLIRGFQAIFLPVGLGVAVLTAWRPAVGALAFLGAFPLVNNWPYFFGVEQNTPHAPAALGLALFFIFGWLGNGAVSALSKRSARGAGIPNNAVTGPLKVVSLLVAVSAVSAYWKWTHFYPFRADGIYDFVANVDGVTTGGARMSALFGALSYLCGFVLFVILIRVFAAPKIRNAAAAVLGGGLLAATAFGVVQILVDPSLGNTDFWVFLKQINATFKDPNAFGAVLAGLGPFVLGAALYFRRGRRLLFGAAFALAVVVYPFIGARSALAGFLAALGGFAIVLFGESGPGAKRRWMWGAAALAAVLAVGGTIGIASGSRLFQRLAASLKGLGSKGGVINISPERYFLWKEALHMTADYPLSGVGIGAFVVEIPNYYARDKRAYPPGFEGWRRVDSAENYFLHAAAEMGLPGLAAILVLFGAVFREIGRGLRRRTELGRERFLFYGASAGLLAFGVNMLFHSYSGSFETQFAFWTLAAFVVVIGRRPGEAESGKTLRRTKIVDLSIASIVIICAGAGLWSHGHTLSLAHKTAEFGLVQNFGLYPEEKTEDGRAFHWTRKNAGVSVAVAGPVIRIPLMASHPDLAENPLRVEIVLVQDMFRAKKILRELFLRESRWETVEIPVSEYRDRRVILLFKTSRTWNPRRATGAPDPRNLGLALGEISFR
jgi:hypothetical protein